MVGVAVAAMLLLLADWSAIQAIFVGLLALVVLGAVLSKFICSSSTAKADLEAVRNGTKGVAATGAAAAAATAAAGAAVVATNASGGSASASPSSSPSAAGSGAGSSDGGSAGASGQGVAASAATTSHTAASSNTAASNTAASSAAANTTPSSFAMQPSAALSGEDDLASRKGEWKYEGDAAAATPAKATPAKAPAAKKPAAKKTAAQSDAPAKKAAPKAAPKKTTAKSEAPAKAARAPVAADGKPETLAKARASGADDLKLISGVGPKLEGTLNELGFYHFDQVASWRKKEVEWVDSRLKFKGRIERDDWISQAKILAKGGETEFSSRKKK